MPSSDPTNLVTTDWLRDHLDAPDLRIVDASWGLPGSGGNPRQEFGEEHIPGAVYFDIDEITDLESPLPHMLPSTEKFASRVRKLGLGDGSRIVVYDTTGVFSAARVWWMFKVMGHSDIAVLDGGLPKWEADGHPIANNPQAPQERHFTARFNNMLVKDARAVLSSTENPRIQVVDARSAERFAGREPEPRHVPRLGRVPGSLNLPFGDLLNVDGTFKSRDEMAEIVAAAGIDMNRPVITSCGSGVTAAILSLALDVLGHRQVSLYDGSWAEWSIREDLPLETGPVVTA